MSNPRKCGNPRESGGLGKNEAKHPILRNRASPNRTMLVEKAAFGRPPQQPGPDLSNCSGEDAD